MVNVGYRVKVLNKITVVDDIIMCSPGESEGYRELVDYLNIAVPLVAKKADNISINLSDISGPPFKLKSEYGAQFPSTDCLALDGSLMGISRPFQKGGMPLVFLLYPGNYLAKKMSGRAYYQIIFELRNPSFLFGRRDSVFNIPQ